MIAKALLATLALLLATAAPASAAIVINEVESSGAFDYIELTNTGGASVDISGCIIKDNNDNTTLVVPAGPCSPRRLPGPARRRSRRIRAR